MQQKDPALGGDKAAWVRSRMLRVLAVHLPNPPDAAVTAGQLQRVLMTSNVNMA